VICLIGSGLLLAESTSENRLTVVGLVASLFAVPLCLMLGQDSLLLLLIASACFYLLRRNADVMAGIVLSLALFKPQLPVILALALLAFRRTRFAISFFSAASVLTVASLAYVGREGLRKLLECTRLAEEYLPIYSMPTVRGLVARFLGDHQKVSSGVFVLGLLVFLFVWRRSTSLEFVFATATCFYTVAALHLYVQDLVILAIPILLYSKLPKYRHDALLLVAFFSFPLFLILTTYNVYALQVIPSIALCAACFRLRTKEQALAVSA
jgi:hypothetical protein